VFGTVLLSVLGGHWCYAHINETQGLEWLNQQVVSSIAPALKLPWILDIDATVKPLYGLMTAVTLRHSAVTGSHSPFPF